MFDLYCLINDVQVLSVIDSGWLILCGGVIRECFDLHHIFVFYNLKIFCIYQIEVHHIISDISHLVNLKQYIDNRDGVKRVD